MKMDDRDLPIFFESKWNKTEHWFGKIMGIRERTRHTRNYSVEWANGEKLVYKGAATRPWFIAHIFKDRTAWLNALGQAAAKAHVEALHKEKTTL